MPEKPAMLGAALDDPPAPPAPTRNAAPSPAPAAGRPAVRTPLRWIQDTIAAPPRTRLLMVGGVALVVAAFVAMLPFYGIWRGMTPDHVDVLSGGGVAACIAQNFPAHLLGCPYMGYPTPYTLAFGYPSVWIWGLLQWLGLGVVNALRLLWVIVLALSFWGTRRLLARVTDVGWLAWAGTLAFLVSPIVVNQNGYGALQLGFMLTPTYLLMDVRLAEALTQGLRRGTVASRALAVVVVRVVALSLDPYSFVISSVGIGLLWLFWGLRRLIRRRWRELAVAVVVVGVSYLLAYVVYQALTNTSGFQQDSLEYFRGSSVDLFSLLVPSTSVWLADATGWHHNIVALQGYSDGHNISDVYLGATIIVLSILALVTARRMPHARAARWLAVCAGAVCLALAIGPSLKFHDFRAAPPGTPLTYSMPASAAGPATPWAWMYQHVPGIELMRAVLRWDLGVRIAGVALAVLGLTWLVRRLGRRWLIIPVLLAALMVAESLPTLPAQIAQHRSDMAAYLGINAAIAQPLKGLVQPGERAILYGPGGVSPGSNDFVANYVCPIDRLECYNAGGDKSLGAAIKGMPQQAREVLLNHGKLGDKGVEAALKAMFKASELDVVILVNFDLTQQAGSWPPAPGVRERGQAAGRRMFTGPGFTRTEMPWFTVIRPAGGG